MIEVDLNSDISTLSTIPYASLNRLSDFATTCISHTVFDAHNNKDNVCCIDLRYGKLYIKFDTDSVAYKFIPSNTLESYVKDAIIKDKDALTTKVEDILKNKILNTYKDFM